MTVTTPKVNALEGQHHSAEDLQSHSSGQTNRAQGGNAQSQRDIVRIGQLVSGHDISRYRYLWDDTFHVGVLAQEIAVTGPEAFVRGSDGYLRVT